MRVRLTHGQLREHLARYRFAAAMLGGRVLDAGCGSGYGTALLAAAPQIGRVVGVDRDARAVAQAEKSYAGPEVSFERRDLLGPALVSLAPFEGIACLEVLEHLPEPELLLQRLDHCLAAGGRLLISTPLGQGRDRPTAQPFHYFQLRRSEFERLLRPRFDFALFGQKGEMIERWRPGGRYFLMLALCRPR